MPGMGWSTDDIFTFINPTITPVDVQSYCIIELNSITDVRENGVSVLASDNTIFFASDCADPCTDISVDPDKI